MMERTMRYWFVIIEVRQGDINCLCKSVYSTKGKTEFDLNAHAKEYFGGAEDTENEGRYEINGGEVLVSAHSCKEMTKKEFDIVSKYIYE